MCINMRYICFSPTFSKAWRLRKSKRKECIHQINAHVNSCRFCPDREKSTRQIRVLPASSSIFNMFEKLIAAQSLPVNCALFIIEASSYAAKHFTCKITHTTNDAWTTVIRFEHSCVHVECLFRLNSSDKTTLTYNKRILLPIWTFFAICCRARSFIGRRLYFVIFDFESSHNALFLSFSFYFAHTHAHIAHFCDIRFSISTDERVPKIIRFIFCLFVLIAFVLVCMRCLC